MVVGDVFRNGRVGPAGDDHVHAGWQVGGEQGGNAVLMAGAVLVETVDEEHEVLTTGAATMGGGIQPTIGEVIQNQFLQARDWPFGAALGMTLVFLFAAAFWFTTRRQQPA